MTDGIPTHLDLFSGIGGFALAAQWTGFRTIGFCEIDPYCRKVLAKNFQVLSNPPSNGLDEHQTGSDDEGGQSTNHEQSGSGRHGAAEGLRSLPRIFADIRTLDGTHFAGVSLITGGFPCQPFSVAGLRRGANDDRAIWHQMFRIINEARPAWVLGENVPGIISLELDNVLSDLEGIGYATRTFVIPACAVDARHRRSRLWIVANCAQFNGERSNQSRNSGGQSEVSTGNVRGDVPNPRSSRLERPRLESQFYQTETELRTSNCCRWQPEPDVGRVAHGIPSRVDRLKGLGNAIVPQVAFQLLQAIRAQLP